MKMKKSVTIVIPTYNRVHKLAALLKSIVPFCREYEIPIIIVDNKSTDTTPVLGEALEKKFRFITYFRNHLNIGAELNILRAVSASETSHVWCIGDDDLLSPRILNEFKKYSYYDNIINSGMSIFTNRVNAKRPLYFNNFKEFSKYAFQTDFEIITEITWISGVIVERSLFDFGAGLRNLNQNFVHTYGYIFNIIKSNLSITVIANKLVIEQSEKGPRAAETKDYLDRVFQYSIFNLLNKIAIATEITQSLSYEHYIECIAKRYALSAHQIAGEEPLRL